MVIITHIDSKCKLDTILNIEFAFSSSLSENVTAFLRR